MIGKQLHLCSEHATGYGEGALHTICTMYAFSQGQIVPLLYISEIPPLHLDSSRG